jgi:hypothetical protein
MYERTLLDVGIEDAPQWNNDHSGKAKVTVLIAGTVAAVLFGASESNMCCTIMCSCHRPKWRSRRSGKVSIIESSPEPLLGHRAAREPCERETFLRFRNNKIGIDEPGPAIGYVFVRS